MCTDRTNFGATVVRLQNQRYFEGVLLYVLNTTNCMKTLVCGVARPVMRQNWSGPSHKYRLCVDQENIWNSSVGKDFDKIVMKFCILY